MSGNCYKIKVYRFSCALLTHFRKLRGFFMLEHRLIPSFYNSKCLFHYALTPHGNYPSAYPNPFYETCNAYPSLITENQIAKKSFSNSWPG